ncbi:hypothetical protein YB2330_002033 [Saitoella coloradoensis]
MSEAAARRIIESISDSSMTDSSSAPSAPTSVATASNILMQDFSLAGRTCIVTGAARGLGREFLHAFANSGATKLACLDINKDQSTESCEIIKSTFASEHPGTTIPDVRPYAVDVTSEEAVTTTINQIISDLGPIHVLVAAAGICQNIPCLTYPASDFRKVFDINVNGLFFCGQAVARSMVDNNVTDGSIIFISSMSAGIVNKPQPQAAYNASKAAVTHLARSMACELASNGIRVNCLAPGYMHTALLDKVLELPGNPSDIWIENTPMKRLGEPQKDLRGPVVFLASNASRFMTGHELVVDGGYSCW